MDIEIRRLVPDLAEDYVRFFDTTPHDDFADEHKCYCVCWCSDDCGGKDFSVFCFTIAPEMKRKGIGTLLLERVCKDAAQDGFDFVEAYPYKEFSHLSSDFGGYVEMYKKCSFYVHLETEQGIVMRKKLR